MSKKMFSYQYVKSRQKKCSFWYAALVLITLFSIVSTLRAQTAPPQPVADPWISYPTANVTSYGVYHFRRTFTLDDVPAQLRVQVSADNRYQLFVNGRRVSYGPGQGRSANL